MKIIKGNIWKIKKADAICITTNGIIGQHNRAVMGKGIALDAKIKHPGIDYLLAKKLNKHGNYVYLLTEKTKKGISLLNMDVFSVNKNIPYHIVSFPTKNHWKEKSSLSLIKKSAKRLVKLADKKKWKKIIVPRPGCNNGELNWKDVKKVIEPIFDNRFRIIRKEKEIKSFKGDYSFLSNFYYCNVEYKGKTWPSLEHLYQAYKTTSKRERRIVWNASSPGEAKKLGNSYKLRENWDKKYKEKYMLKFVRLKFKQNKVIRKKLLKTKKAILIEGNTWHDNYWGDCKCKKCKDIKGQNNLGKILMKVREEFENV